MHTIFYTLKNMLLMCLLMVRVSHAQTIDSVVFTGCHKPTLLAAHPLGQFIGLIQHNFKTSPVRKPTLTVGLNNANIWQPLVIGYLPHDPNVTQWLSSFPWHQRDSIFQAFPQEYDSIVCAADGVTRTLHLQLRYKLTQYSEIEFNIRGILFTGGQVPTAIITSDAFIERFHTHIAGGEDPFARKQYDFNDAYLFYKDREGRTIRVNKNEFIIPGIQVNYHRYLSHESLLKRHIQFSYSIHTSVNTTSFNQSVDGGLSATLQKQFNQRNTHFYTFAAAFSVLQQKLLKLQQTIDFSSNNLLKSAEVMFEYKKNKKHDKFNAIGLHFYYLDAYLPSQEFSHITPVGNRISSHWHLALNHLYRNSQYWSLVYTYGHQWIWSLYILQDFKVNNAPDLQTGISVDIPLYRK